MSRKAGVMGWPVTHSLSPRLHGYWLHFYGVAGNYQLLPVNPEDIGNALVHLRESGFVGVNLTVPHKELALPYMGRVDPRAFRAGAVNTVLVHPDGTLEGRNTDVFGFSQNLLAGGYTPSRRPAAIIGAGGAARSAVVALLDMGLSEIRITNRTLVKAETLQQQFGPCIRVFSWNDPTMLRDVDLLVNCTILGMTGQAALTINLESLPSDALVTDMVYAPLVTDLLARASAQGNKTVDGLGMLLHQARPAFHAFFGVDPEVTPELRAHILQAGP